MKLSSALEGFFLARRAEGYSPHTLSDYAYTLQRLLRYLDDPELDAIGPVGVRGYLAEERERTHEGRKLSAHTLSNEWVAIRSFFGWALSEGLITVRPDEGIKRPAYVRPVIEPFTQAELKAILQAAEYTRPAATQRRQGFQMKRPTARRDVALVLLLLDTGLRVGEVAQLRIGDLDLEAGEITVRPYNSGRKSRGRLVYLGVAARKALWRYLSGRQADRAAPLFLTTNQLPMDRSAISHVVRHLGERAGVAQVHPHRFRHTMAITFLRNGGDVFSLQRLLGHSTLDMVRQYLALADADAAAAHRKASPADNWRL